MGGGLFDFVHYYFPCSAVCESDNGPYITCYSVKHNYNTLVVSCSLVPPVALRS